VVAAGELLVRAVRGSCTGGGDGESATGLQHRSAIRFSRDVMARASAACAAAEMMVGWRLRLLFRFGVLAMRAGRLVGRLTSEGGVGWFRRLLSMTLRKSIALRGIKSTLATAVGRGQGACFPGNSGAWGR
jgi:hypothetical protein